MKRLFMSLLLALALLLAIPTPPAAATSPTPLAWASATGNLSLSPQSDGAAGVAMTQNLQLFTEGTMGACENTFNSATGATYPGGWVIGNFGGQRSLGTTVGWTAGQYGYYANMCSYGYNQSASIMVRANFKIFMKGSGGGVGGSLRLGLSTRIASPTTQGPCGPFLEIKLGSTGAITGLGLGVTVGKTPTSATWFSAISTVSIANNTWTSAFLWSNNTALHGQVAGATVTATQAWTSLACYPGQAEEQQINGAIMYLNQTSPSGFPGASWQFATNNVTIGSSQRFGATQYRSVGYATSTAFTPSSRLTALAFSILSPTHFREFDAGPIHVYETGPTNYLCPCYVNSSSGVNVFTTLTPVALPSAYGLGSYTLNVTGVTPGLSLTLAFRFNSTDGLATSFVSGVSVPPPSIWNNPSQGTTGAITQEASWVGPFVLFVLLVALGMAFYESFRRKLDI